MNDPNDSTNTSDSDSDSASSTFLEFCEKVRNNDPFILPEPGRDFRIRYLDENEDMELAGALLENSNITYLRLATKKYEKLSEAW
jgi:hypothetical protein